MAAFRIGGDLEIHPDLGCVRTSDGTDLRLRPKAFQLLLHLFNNRHRLVTKQELNDHIWPETAVTDDGVVQCVVELRKALGDAAREPRYIRTTPRVGYRFIADVHEIPVAAPLIAEAEVVPAVAPSPRRWPVAAVVAIASIAAVTILIVRGVVRTETAALDPTSGKPGIAVMLLDNRSRSADIDWMREGLAEMLITGLSRSDRVNVLGRQHLRTLLERIDHPLDQEISLDVAREVARRSHAGFVLMGSFARVENTTRIDVRIESVDAKQVASETLTVDRPEEILTQVDLLAWKLARTFDSGVQRPGEMSASGLTANLEAYRAYSLGLAKAAGFHVSEAAAAFEHALALDPNFVMARARLGYVYGVTSEQGSRARPYLEEAFKSVDRLRESDRLYIEAWYAMVRNDFPAAIRPLQRIIRLYPYEIEAYDRLARLLRGERRNTEAIDVARRGLLIDPESIELHNTLGTTYGYVGRHDDAIAAHRRYVALAPNEPNSYDSLGLSLQTAGRYEEAEAAFNRALELKPDFEVAIVHLGNVYFHTGRYRLAAASYERYVALSKWPPARSRGLQALATVHSRGGRMAAAKEAALAADREGHADTPALWPWATLMIRALSRERLVGLPTLEQFAAYPNRGSRASTRSFLWLIAQDALIAGDAPRALDTLRLLLLENPIYWSIDPFEDSLALAYMELSRWDDAIAELGRILRTNPRYPRAHYHLAIAYERKGDRAAARQAFAEFLKIWSGADDDVPEIIDARARLARLSS